MNIEFTSHAWEEFTYWLENDTDVAAKIKDLLKSVRQDPFKGIGKPEPLKFALRGFWSTRITGEHRLVYSITGTKGVNQKCTVVQCKFHYGDK